MKKFCLLFLSSLLSISLISQNPTVMKIWQTYNTAKSTIEAQQNGDIPEDHYKFILNQNLPAVGPQTITYDLYFSLVEQYDDDDFYEQEINIAQKSYNIAGREFTEEYLFEDEKLIYFFYKEYSDNCREIRIYFDNEEVVRFSETILNYNNCEDIISQVEYNKTNLPSDYDETVQTALSDANFIVKIFILFNVY
ncbi:MAG: hypothetical protein JXR68_08760 [Bacteroidales bacterium]|nr:hypothetical protein [Bacteroidales bacterium]